MNSKIFLGIGCFEDTFSLQVKECSYTYQAPLTHVAYVLQKPCNEELESLQQLNLTVPLGVDEAAEWYNTFVLVPKSSGKVRLCLGLAWLNQALIRPVH